MLSQILIKGEESTLSIVEKTSNSVSSMSGMPAGLHALLSIMVGLLVKSYVGVQVEANELPPNVASGTLSISLSMARTEGQAE